METRSAAIIAASRVAALKCIPRRITSASSRAPAHPPRDSMLPSARRRQIPPHDRERSPRRSASRTSAALLGTEAQSIVEEWRSKARARPHPRHRCDGEVKNLRFSRPHHQHAVCDDCATSFTDNGAVTGGGAIANVSSRPRRRMGLGFQSGNRCQVGFPHRPPERAGDAYGRGSCGR